jgi:subtilisin family serine protease
MRGKLVLALVSLMLAACSEAPSTPRASQIDESRASFAVGAAEVIPGRFIVTLREDANPAAVAREHGVTPDFVYTHALKGFAGDIADAAREGLLRDARVSSVEPDGVMSASIVTQSNATWGIDRVDQHALPVNGTYTYANTGAGVTAYIIDTGIRFDHAEFGGRAVTGFDAVTSGGNAADCNGHGTHVSGTVGGATYGVAKGVTLVAVRVLNCSGSGTTSGVIAGIDWVTGDHTTGPAVANMSLGGGASSALDAAVRRSIADGVTYAIAAGNGNIAGIAQDACKTSPARVTEAITVSATDATDRKASWANYGNCVDWFAPGVGITSSWYTSSTATVTISGTSMATPHTTGVAALYLQSNPLAPPQQVRDALFDNTTKSVVSSSRTTNNHLLFTNY